MKLLFDENLSPRLASLLADVYPGSTHVHGGGLGSADDEAVWKYARDENFSIVIQRLRLSRAKRAARLSAQDHLASCCQLHNR